MQLEPKNPNQLNLELPSVKEGVSSPEPGSDQVREMSEVAQVQAQVLELGLVRVAQPVFLYDKNLAKSKLGNASRQEKFRVEREKQGLKTGLAPIDVLEKVKALGGGADGWIKFLAQSGNGKEDSSVTGNGVGAVVIERVEVPVEVIREIFVDRVVEKMIEVEVIKEVITEKIVEVEVIKEVPGPTIYREKIVEKPVVRLNAEQKKAWKIGEKVVALKGWRFKLVQLIAGIHGVSGA